MWEDKYDLDMVQTHNHNTHNKLWKLHYIAFMTVARGQKTPDLVSVRKNYFRIVGLFCLGFF